MILSENDRQDLLFRILQEKYLIGILDDITNQTEWWIRITNDKPDLDEIIRRYYISCLY